MPLPFAFPAAPDLVGARLRRARTPTRPHASANMGEAQLASHSLLYPNSRMRPIYFFPAASAAAVTPEACPYQRPHPVGTRLRRVRPPCRPRPPPGRGASETRPRTPWKGAPTNIRPLKQRPRRFCRGLNSNGNCIRRWP